MSERWVLKLNGAVTETLPNREEAEIALWLATQIADIFPAPKPIAYTIEPIAETPET